MNLQKNTPAVFLDRDGTIIEEVGYLNSTEKVKLLPGATPALQLFNKMGFKVIVISNQSGVARGFFTEETVQLVNSFIVQLFAHRKAQIDGIYYCPHHPEGKITRYKRSCHCRKPESGMLLQATQDHHLDLKHSFLIGDKYIDIQTGKRLNLFSILVLTGYGRLELDQFKDKRHIHQPDFIARDVWDAANLILKNINATQGSR